MSEYENVVVGKLRLKGRALGVKGGGIRKKKKPKKHFDSFSQPVREDDPSTGRNPSSLVALSKENTNHTDIDGNGGNGRYAAYGDQLTPAERSYHQQWEKIDLERMAKMARKSHRERVQEFNRYLANLSEHHDIPKVGPG